MVSPGLKENYEGRNILRFPWSHTINHVTHPTHDYKFHPDVVKVQFGDWRFLLKGGIISRGILPTKFI